MNSRQELIRAHLLKHGSINELEAAVNYGCFSLSRVISRLRDSGMDLKHESVDLMVKLLSGRVSECFGKYTLQPDKEVIGLESFNPNGDGDYLRVGIQISEKCIVYLNVKIGQSVTSVAAELLRAANDLLEGN